MNEEPVKDRILYLDAQNFGFGQYHGREVGPFPRQAWFTLLRLGLGQGKTVTAARLRAWLDSYSLGGDDIYRVMAQARLALLRLDLDPEMIENVRGIGYRTPRIVVLGEPAYAGPSYVDDIRETALCPV